MFMCSKKLRASGVVTAIAFTLALTACGRTEPVASGDTTTTTLPAQSAPSTGSTAPTTAAPQPSSYVIQPGDSLGAIAAAFGISQEVLIEFNNLADPNRIAAGQQLLIPPGATSTTTTPTTAAPPPPEPDPAAETTVAG